MPRQYDPQRMQPLPLEIRLPEQLRDLRTFQGLTQQEIADSLHMDRSAYSNYETGKAQPSLLNLVKISQIFNVTTDCLLGIQRSKNGRSLFEQELLQLVKRHFPDLQ